eukprot:Phypoly_transcript_25509.p1 GENE.Phypoly_transcript_25509~~Phypoly_transcript_25509.p1  ORF type:complete len:124 (+),score=12.91 Phypoly_transcript_25509:3-374(+)
MGKQTATVLCFLVLLVSCISAFKHKNYCGEISRWGQVVTLHIHVHDQEKVHIKATGAVDVDKDFRIYKKEGNRIFIRICTETGLLCKEEYKLFDNEDSIRVEIDLPFYATDIEEDLLPCPTTI